MIEKGQELPPDTAPNGTIAQPIIHFFFPSNSDSVTGSMTPQQVKDRGRQQYTHNSLPSVGHVPSEETPQQQSGNMDQLEHPVLDDIDMTLRRKVSSCKQEDEWAAGCRAKHRAAIQAKY